MTPDAILERVLATPDGASLLLGSLRGLPLVTYAPPVRRLFRSSPEWLQLGDWRYTVVGGQLEEAHVVNGIVLAHRLLPPRAAARSLAAALDALVQQGGHSAQAEVTAVLAGLEAAVG